MPTDPDDVRFRRQVGREQRTVETTRLTHQTSSGFVPDVGGIRCGFLHCKRCAPDSTLTRSEYFFKMKARQTTARLLGGHFLGNFRANRLKSALSIKPISSFLNLSCAHNHLCESEGPRFGLCTI